MENQNFPTVFSQLISAGCIRASDVLQTQDGFVMIYKSLSDLLAQKGILDVPDADGTRLACDKFYDDWFLYAIVTAADPVYSLVKMREQEFDALDASPADSDAPGVTVSFIDFRCEVLTACFAEPSDENRRKLEREIHRVVAARGSRHHRELKRYFVDKKTTGAYFIADLYTRHIAALSENGSMDVPESYRALVGKRKARLPECIASLNRAAGYTVCDNEKIYIKSKDAPTDFERTAILATHTGNTSDASFAAEVRIHAMFLTPLAKLRIPFVGRSAYDSAIRADMLVDDKEGTLLTWFLQKLF